MTGGHWTRGQAICYGLLALATAAGTWAAALGWGLRTRDFSGDVTFGERKTSALRLATRDRAEGNAETSGPSESVTVAVESSSALRGTRPTDSQFPRPETLYPSTQGTLPVPANVHGSKAGTGAVLSGEDPFRIADKNLAAGYGITYVHPPSSAAEMKGNPRRNGSNGEGMKIPLVENEAANVSTAAGAVVRLVRIESPAGLTAGKDRHPLPIWDPSRSQSVSAALFPQP